MLDDLAIFVINLDRAADRMERMRERLAGLGLPYTRIEAVDGQQCKFNHSHVDRTKYASVHGRYVTGAEVACFMSHFEAMKRFLATDSKFALILEDDMMFEDDFLDLLRALLSDESWDMVKLNGGHRSKSVFVKNVVGRYSLVKDLFHQSKAGAYLINRHAAMKYLAKLLPMFVPIDHEYIKFWKYGINGFCVLPFPAREEGSASTIDYELVRQNRKPMWAKIPTFLYKLWIAMRRVMWVVGRHKPTNSF
ncbi:MAG: glycosyltransferase family 25 protein [Rickettsiales bacterium]|jgi:glycosyl transferase family 25|nr:glycosyltransferase family 25 protein [Rickettsiales bacterium]